MLTEHLPQCPYCGMHQWQPNGAHIRSDLPTWYFICGYCQRQAIHVRHAGGNILVIGGNPGDMRRSVIDWLNQTVISAWQGRAAQIEEARKPIIERWRNYVCEEVGLPRGTPAKEVPEAKLDAWREFLHLLDSYPAYRKPKGFERPPLPPQMPQGIAVYLIVKYNGDKPVWEAVERDATLALPTGSAA